MLRPTERPPASAAPRLAASIRPGPPPVITVKPWSARQAAVSRQSSYQLWPSGIRAEPKTETPSSMSRRASKPLSTSARMRSARASSSPSTSQGTRSRCSSRFAPLLSPGPDRVHQSTPTQGSSNPEATLRQQPCDRLGRLLRTEVGQVDGVLLEGAEIRELGPQTLEHTEVAAGFSPLPEPRRADRQRGPADGVGDLEAGGMQHLPQRVEEPPWDDDPVDDREVARPRVRGSRLGDDPDHEAVLLVGLRLPRLDVSGADEAKERIRFQVDRRARAFGEDARHGGLANPGRPGEDQDLNVAWRGHAPKPTGVSPIPSSAPGGTRTRDARLKRPPL